jgi:hypothetical protein
MLSRVGGWTGALVVLLCLPWLLILMLVGGVNPRHAKQRAGRAG